MIRVDLYQDIRKLWAVEGLSKREIARRLGVSRNTVKRYCEGGHVPWEKKKSQRKSPVITEEVIEFVRNCLEGDSKAPRKQRHTSHRIFKRLQEELGYEGAESTIRRLVGQLRPSIRNVYIPLFFEPGEAAQVDWGEAVFHLNGEKIKANLFCMRLCHSAMPFVMAFPSQRREAFIGGHIKAFEFFGGVPKRLIYDNLRTAVKEGWGKDVKEEQKDFLALKAHYAFNSEFCNAGAGHEKGLVENLIGWVRRNFLTPVPRVESWEELNNILLTACQNYKEHRIRDRSQTVGEAFAVEQQALTVLPKYQMDYADVEILDVDPFSTVRFDRNRYSVPVEYAGKTVTVKGYPFEVKISYQGVDLAAHPRLYKNGETHYVLDHYLSLLEQRPRAVWNARPLKEAGLPQKLLDFARKLPSNFEFVKVLKLISERGLEVVLEAVDKAEEVGSYTYEMVRYYVFSGKNSEQEVPVLGGPAVEPVHLEQYDLLIAGGDGK